MKPLSLTMSCVSLRCLFPSLPSPRSSVQLVKGQGALFTKLRAFDKQQQTRAILRAQPRRILCKFMASAMATTQNPDVQIADVWRQLLPSEAIVGSLMLPSDAFNPPLKSIDDVLTLMEIARGRLQDIAFDSNAATVLDLGDGRVVKAGRKVSPVEALAMEYVRQNTTIPVPNVHMVFRQKASTYIVMARAPGRSLEYACSSMSIEQMRNVAVQCADYITQLRKLGASYGKTTMGQWPEGPFRNIHFLEQLPEHEFHSLHDFYRYWFQRACLYRKPDPSADISMPAESADVVLSHGDFCPQNIVVHNGNVTGVLDWETFGWYPDFWDSMRFTGRSPTLEMLGVNDDVFGRESELSRHIRSFFTICMQCV